MNLVAYDNVNKFIPSDNYIQNSYKRLLSATIEYHDVYCLLKRYNVDKDKYDFYVLFMIINNKVLKINFLRRILVVKLKFILMTFGMNFQIILLKKTLTLMLN